MLKIEDLRYCRCRFCHGLFVYSPSSNGERQIFINKDADVCNCGRSGKQNRANKYESFRLYYNYEFTIDLLIYYPLQEVIISLIENTDGRYLSGNRIIPIPYHLCQVDFLEQLYSMVDCFIGTLAFK
jgi:hypothetical protein